MTSVFFNELHYENIGIDCKEGVEVAGPSGTNLDGWGIHVYNGDSGKVEYIHKLRGVIPNLSSGWGVIFFYFALKNHSHGTGLALVDNKNQVVQFLSYSAKVQAKEGPASGKQAALIPVVETVWNSVGHSLQLKGKGNKYEDFVWVGPERASYGSINNGQVFTPLEVLSKISGIDFLLEKNRTKHHTDKFHGTDMVIVRRGDTFDIDITEDHEPKVETLALRLAVYPEGGKLEIKVLPSQPDQEDGLLTAFLTSVEKNVAHISISIPGDFQVGEYLFSISIDGGKSWSAETHLVILFNAWSPKDSVYMENDAERNEYVLADDGLIWVGNQHANSPVAWNFAQFNIKSLLAILKLVKRIPLADRGNTVIVSRAISALVNAADDNGVLVGNWSSDFSGGTSPSAWTGSGEILKEYLLTGKPVKYGQCWVFSGVVTAVMRGLGVPCRSITNFASAHDVPEPNYNRSVDKYFQRGGLKIDEDKTRDSIWNFHVWNDVWTERPDLGPQFFGWQAIDATPQEESDGKYQTGPAPLVAIKEGNKDVKYDLEFIYSEVNADENYYVENDDGKGYKLVRTITDSIGKKISTKAVGQNQRNDITLDYKYPEGSIEERASHGATDTKTGDVKITWDVIDSTKLGATVPAKLTLTTAHGLTRSARVDLVAAVIKYTGKLRQNIKEQTKNVVVTGDAPVVIQFNLDPREYEKVLYGDNSFIFKAFVSVKETQQTSLVTREFDFSNFALLIDVPPKISVGVTTKATVTFTNTLSIPLTKLVLSVEGQGITKLQKFDYVSVKPGETITQAVVLTPSEKGKHLIIVHIQANEASDIDGHDEVTVE